MICKLSQVPINNENNYLGLFGNGLNGPLTIWLRTHALIRVKTFPLPPLAPSSAKILNGKGALDFITFIREVMKRNKSIESRRSCPPLIVKLSDFA